MQHYFQYIKNYLNVSFEEVDTWLALCLQLKESNRAIINQMLKAIWDCLFFSFLLIGLKNSGHPLNKSDAKLEQISTFSHAFSHTSSCLLFSLQVLIWLHVILILSSGKPFSDHFSFGYTTTMKKHYNEILIFFAGKWLTFVLITMSWKQSRLTVSVI